MSRLTRSALLAGALLAGAAAPATSDAAIFTGKANGYKLTLNSSKQFGALTIPQEAGGGQTVYTAFCARRASRKGKLVLSVVPITASRRLSAPLNRWRAANRRCTITVNDQTVAKLRLRRR